MEKTTQNMVQGTKPDSATLNQGVIDGPSSRSRCSNSSSVYCNSRHVQNSNFQDRKRLPTQSNSPPSSKRNRNSSSSSVSSNASCISDKDVKKATVIISPNYIPQESVSNSEIMNNITNLNEDHHKINSSTVGVQYETIRNGRLSCSDHPTSVSPVRYNLRRNIRKKTCSCDCTATCTTLVVRRYKEIGRKTVKEETVIYSTEVKTFVPQSTTQNMCHVSGINDSSTKSEVNRKRRSEVQKLYDSLHQIEWAKNFSPDNILRQTKIRQAASSSLFGRPIPNQTHLNEKSVKRQTVMNSHRLRSSSTRNKSVLSLNRVKVKSELINARTEMSTSCSFKINNTRKKTTVQCKYNPKKLMSQKSDGGVVKETITPKIEKNINSLNFTLYGKTDKSDAQSSADKATCSASHIKQEISIISPPESPKTIYHSASVTDIDSQFPFLSVDSSSITGSTSELPSKNVLDLQYKYKSDAGIIAPLDISEYSVTPTFFDIAEEGIRSIDACFRDVGAEVVVSTSYEDDECVIPCLTSIIDTDVSKKIPSDEGQQLCFDITDKKLITPASNMDTEKNTFDIDGKNANNNSNLKDNCNVKDTYKTEKVKNSEPYMSNKSSNARLIGTKGKHILNKYLKYFQSKEKLHLPVVKRNKLVNKCFSQNGISKRKYSASNQNLIPSPSCSTSSTSFKSLELPCQTIGSKMQQSTLSQTLDQKASICKYPNNITYDYSKNDSFLYHTEKELLTHQDGIRKILSSSLVQNPRGCYIEHTSLTSCLRTENEKDNKHEDQHVPRPATSFNPTLQYKSIKVNRNNHYTQVVLKLTRGRSIFLTLEALRELRDVVNRTAIDRNSQVLILNGIGDSFCLGLDLRPLVGPKKIKSSTEMAVAIKEMIEALADFKKPFVAVVNGPALGLGMTLLNYADVTIASDRATFCMPYSYLGYVPEGGATLTLPLVVGSTVAMDLLVRGRTLTAREARNVGLISEVHEAESLPHELVSRVKTLTENSISALEVTKALMRMPLHLDLRVVLEEEVKLFPRMWLTRQCQDALRNALRSGILSG